MTDRLEWVRPAPAVAAFAAAALGLILGRALPQVHAGWWFAAALAGPIPFAVRARGLPAAAALFVSLAAVAGGWFSLRAHQAPGDSLTRSIDPSQRRLATAEGLIISEPEIGPAQWGHFSRFVARPPATRFLLRADRWVAAEGESRPVSGKLRVRVSEPALGLDAGNRARVSGFLVPIRSPRNPGEPDGRLRANQSNIAGRLLVSSRSHVETLPPSDSTLKRLKAGWLHWRAALRARTSALLDASLAGSLGGTRDEQSADSGKALLEALLLGERGEGLREVRGAFTRIGAAHMLAISGFHLGVLVWLTMLALRAIGAQGRLEPIIVAAAVLLFVMIVPARTPIIRAAIMALGYLTAEASGRRYRPLAVLAWTGLIVLAWRPMELWSPGFQLSFGVVAGLVTLTVPLRARFFPVPLERDAVRARDWIFDRLKSWVAFAVCAWLISTPIVLHHWGFFSPWAVLSSIALFPLIAISLGVGALALAAGALTPSIGAAVFGPVLSWSGQAAVHLAQAVDAAPASIARAPTPPTWWTLAALALLGWWMSARAKRPGAQGCIACALALWLLMRATIGGAGSSAPLRIDTLAVGDGACHLVRSRGEALLWDCGSMRLWLGERAIPAALRDLGAWRLRRVVLSHPNLDHYSALPDVIEPMGVEEVIVGRATLVEARQDPSGPVAALVRELDERAVAVRVVRAGDSLRVGEASVRFIHPPRDWRGRTSNDASLTARLEAPTRAGPRAALLCGDLEDDGIERIERVHPDLRAEIMEAPHHGSADQTAFSFVERVDPRVVVQSTGMSRAGDERWDDVRAGRTWLTTATDGAASVIVREDGAIKHRTMREPRSQ